MPARDIIFENGNIYHIFNKTIDSKKIFDAHNTCNIFLEIAEYYRSTKSITSYSIYRRLDSCKKNKIIECIHLKSYYKVQVHAYCLMPNHFHFLIQQKLDCGVQKYMSDIVNSFTRYYNILLHRKGPLFITQFKCVEVRSDEQLMHVSRYIHLNPYSSHIVKSKSELVYFEPSSYRYYISPISSEFVEVDPVLRLFGRKRENYEKFGKVYD